MRKIAAGAILLIVIITISYYLILNHKGVKKLDEITSKFASNQEVLENIETKGMISKVEELLKEDYASINALEELLEIDLNKYLEPKAYSTIETSNQDLIDLKISLENKLETVNAILNSSNQDTRSFDKGIGKSLKAKYVELLEKSKIQTKIEELENQTTIAILKIEKINEIHDSLIKNKNNWQVSKEKLKITNTKYKKAYDSLIKEYKEVE